MSISTDLSKGMWRWPPLAWLCTWAMAALLALSAVGCASQQKQPKTVEDFLKQPRPQ